MATSVRDIEIMFRRYVLALQRAGADVTGYQLQHEGNGLAWRAYVIDPITGGASNGAGGNFLGNTRKEAFYALVNRAETIEDLIRLQKGQGK